MFTIARVAEMLGEYEEWLHELADPRSATASLAGWVRNSGARGTTSGSSPAFWRSGRLCRRRLAERPDARRQGEAQRLEDTSGGAGGLGGQFPALALLLDGGVLQPVEVAPHVIPLELQADLRAAIGQLLLQHQGEEGAEDVAADGGVGGVEDRSRVERGLGRAEHLLDPEQVSIAEHGQQRTDAAVDAQHEDAVELGFVGKPARIDFEGRRGGCDRRAVSLPDADAAEIASVGGVADEGLVAALQLLLERGDDRLAVGAVLLGLGLVATGDVAAGGDENLLGEELGLLPGGAGDQQRREGALVSQDHVAHQAVAALAGAEHIFQAAFFQAGDGGFRDHAAIGDDADAADAEASAQAVDHRQQHADIGGVAGPHLRADRSALGVHDEAEDHLHQVRPVVLGVAALAERLPALAGEAEGGGVHEDDGEFAEQVAPAFEQRLLDLVLDAAWREGRRVLLPIVLGVEFLAEPSHGAVEVVKIEVVGAGDVVIGHPLLTGAVGTGDHQAMQDSGEYRPLNGEAEAASGEQRLEHGAAAKLVPEASKGHRYTDAAQAELRGALVIVERGEQQHLFAEAGAGGQQRGKAAVGGEFVGAADSGDDVLLDARAVAAAFDDLEVAARAGGLETEEHSPLRKRSSTICGASRPFKPKTGLEMALHIRKILEFHQSPHAKSEACEKSPNGTVEVGPKARAA